MNGAAGVTRLRDVSWIHLNEVLDFVIQHLNQSGPSGHQDLPVQASLLSDILSRLFGSPFRRPRRVDCLKPLANNCSGAGGQIPTHVMLPVRPAVCLLSLDFGQYSHSSGLPVTAALSANQKTLETGNVTFM